MITHPSLLHHIFNLLYGGVVVISGEIIQNTQGSDPSSTIDNALVSWTNRFFFSDFRTSEFWIFGIGLWLIVNKQTRYRN